MTSLAASRAADAGAPSAAADLCAHCGAALNANQPRFCCTGCSAAYAIVHELGLDQFYRRRQAGDAAVLRPGPDTADYTAFVTVDKKNNRSTLHLMVDGITCGACVWLIESVLAREANIVEARVNLSTRRLVIRWAGPTSDANHYVHRVTELGFRLMPYDPTQLRTNAGQAERELQQAMGVAGFAAGNVMLLSVAVWAGYFGEMGPATRDLLHWISAAIALPAITYAGRPFFRSALQALASGRTNMDVPISIGVLLAAGMSLFETWTSGVHAYFDSAITLLFFLLVGRYLDARARGQARSVAENLIALRAGTVTVLSADGMIVRKRPDSVLPGETVLVAAGERIGIDGRVSQGVSDLDASLVTGESVPQAAVAGTAVFAGMVNLSAPLRVMVTVTGEGTLLAEIVRLMEAAEHGRGKFVALADRVARAYAPGVHLLAAATFIGWYSITGAGAHAALLNAIAVLIITCPCALALAIPVVQVAASGRLLKQGILLKSATALERLASVDTIVFDKTGTLTVGQAELEHDGAWSPADLTFAASIAQSSRHPLARTLVRACPGATPLENVIERPGQGLSVPTRLGEVRLGSRTFCGAGVPESGETGPELWLAMPGSAPARFGFRDRLRSDAAAVISALCARGIQVWLLSGDRTSAVRAIAQQAGIEIWQAECDPAAKVAALAALRAAGHSVLMVGDGLNDAPALAAADVSASPASAADISQAAADVVFQGDRLSPVLEILTVARRCRRLGVQNLILAIGYNLIAVPLAVAGLVTPLIAAAAMSSSSLAVIANSLRLSRRQGAA